ncbi:hypothetical protein BOX15_Mlig010778g1, partial [Macrostomum lignano]
KTNEAAMDWRQQQQQQPQQPQAPKAADFKRRIDDLIARTRVVRDNSSTTTRPSSSTSTAAAAASPQLMASPFAVSRRGAATANLSTAPSSTVRVSQSPSPSESSSDSSESSQASSAAISRQSTPAAGPASASTAGGSAGHRLIEVIPNRAPAVASESTATPAANSALPSAWLSLCEEATAASGGQAAVAAAAALRKQLTQLDAFANADPRDYYGQASEELANLAIQLEALERQLTDLNTDALDVLLELAAWMSPDALDPALNAAANCRRCTRLAFRLSHDADDSEESD